MNSFRIGSGHVCLSGQTQYGKSWFAKNKLFRKYPRAIFYDLKHDPNHSDLTNKYKVITSVKQLKKVLKEDSFHVVYRPPYLGFDDAVDHFDTVCRTCFESGNVALFNDEAAGTTKASSIGHWFFVLMTQGLSRGCNVINITQRPTACHNAIISQSDYFILFRHNVKSDREKLEGVIGEPAQQTATLSKYSYIFVHPDRSFQKVIYTHR